MKLVLVNFWILQNLIPSIYIIYIFCFSSYQWWLSYDQLPFPILFPKRPRDSPDLLDTWWLRLQALGPSRQWIRLLHQWTLLDRNASWSCHPEGYQHHVNWWRQLYMSCMWELLAALYLNRNLFTIYTQEPQFIIWTFFTCQWGLLGIYIYIYC